MPVLSLEACYDAFLSGYAAFDKKKSSQIGHHASFESILLNDVNSACPILLTTDCQLLPSAGDHIKALWALFDS